jgi:hypothetical protein
MSGERSSFFFFPSPGGGKCGSDLFAFSRGFIDELEKRGA